MLPQRKDPIPNQYINMLGTGKDQSLPPQIDKFPLGFRSLINYAEDDRNDSINMSRTDK